jgi:hypothetical protein
MPDASGPNLIVIGAMKAGTTSFHNYLDLHPEIAMTAAKETNFFSNPVYWNRGVDWYFSQFDARARVRGETSTAYTGYPLIDNVPQRMHDIAGEAKLIYLVRDPIDRLLSQYVHSLSEDVENRSLSEVVTEIRRGRITSYVCHSQYFAQIERYLPHFDRSQLLVLTAEGLKKRRLETLLQVCDFLGVERSFSAQMLEKTWNTADERFVKTWWGRMCYPQWLQTHPRIPWRVKSPFYRLARLGSRPIPPPRLSEDETETLMQLFRPDVEALRRFTGQSLAEWRAY